MMEIIFWIIIYIGHHQKNISNWRAGKKNFAGIFTVFLYFAYNSIWSFWRCEVREVGQRRFQMWELCLLQLHSLYQGLSTNLTTLWSLVLSEQRQQEVWLSDSLGLMDRPQYFPLWWLTHSVGSHEVLSTNYVSKNQSIQNYGKVWLQLDFANQQSPIFS